MPAKSVGKVHQIFEDRLKELREQAKLQAAAARGQQQRHWQLPDAKKWSGDPYDIAGLTAVFNRDPINQNFAQVFADPKNPGTVGDVISLKAQADYLAVMERGLRARLAGPCRCLAMAAARRAGHGHEKGVFAGGVLRYATTALQAGNK